MRIRLIALICSAVVIAGCGKATPTVGTQKIDEETSIAVPTFAAETAMARIQQAGHLNVGISYSQGAFSSHSSSDSLSGFDVQMAQYIAQAIFGGTKGEAAQKITYVQAEANNRESFISDKSVDIALGAYQITPARQAQIYFAGPEYAARAQAVVPVSDKQTQTIASLNGRNACVVSANDLAGALNSAAPQTNIVNMSTLSQCQDALKAGTVDAVVGFDWQLGPLVQANASIRFVDSTFATINYGIGLASGDIQFRQFLNQTLRKVEDTKQWAAAFAATLGAAGVPLSDPPAIDTSVPSPSITTTTTTLGDSTTTAPGLTSSTTTGPVVVSPPK